MKLSIKQTTSAIAIGVLYSGMAAAMSSSNGPVLQEQYSDLNKGGDAYFTTNSAIDSSSNFLEEFRNKQAELQNTEAYKMLDRSR